MRILTLTALLALAAGPAAPVLAEIQQNAVGFAAGQPIAATLQLNHSEKGRNARMTPVYSQYRPKVRFGGRDVVCMIRFTGAQERIAPGESGPVSLACEESVSVARNATRFIVVEGSKPVGSVEVQLPPPGIQ